MTSPSEPRASHSPPNPSPPTNTPYNPAEVLAVTTQASTTIEADSAPPTDDEAYGSDTNSNASTSLSSSVRNYLFENGRRYHKFREGSYQFPNDDAEQDREDMKHAMIVNLCGGKLCFAPIGENPQNVIDLGTGTGIWCMDMGDEYPSAQILGIDLSPIQPNWVPPNVKFMVDDAEDPWLEKEDFYDLVHARHVTQAFKNFPTLLQRAYKHIKPGGWIEIQEMHHLPHCDDGTMPTEEGSEYPLWIYFRTITRGLFALGVKLDASLATAQNLGEYGFTNVHHEIFKIPIGTWPKNKTLKTVGLYAKVGILDGLQAMSMASLTRGLGWKREEVEVMLVDVRKCLMDGSVHAYLPFHVIYGQKPLNGGGGWDES